MRDIKFSLWLHPLVLKVSFYFVILLSRCLLSLKFYISFLLQNLQTDLLAKSSCEQKQENVPGIIRAVFILAQNICFICYSDIPSVHIRKGVKDRTFNMNTEIADLFCIAQKTMISDIYSLCTQCRPKHVRSIIKSTGKWVGETNYSMSTFRKCIR